MNTYRKKEQMYKMVKNILLNHNSIYITNTTLKAKTGLSKGQLSIALRRLKSEHIITKRTKVTWRINKTK